MNCDDVALELNTTYQKALALMTCPGFPAIRIGKQLHTTRDLLNKWIKHHSGESFSDKCNPEQRERKTLRHQNKSIKEQMKKVGGWHNEQIPLQKHLSIRSQTILA